MDLEEDGQSLSVSTRTFVTARINEVVALSKEIQQQSGLEAKGLAFQHVPKHMRRRAVSHNVKRLPKRLQTQHRSQSAKSGGRVAKPKRPRTKYRPRKTDFVAEFNRRQSSVSWIETHVWHAKRFHMEKKWGYRIPIQPTDKSYRAIYRGFSKYSIVQDISYYSCLQLSGQSSTIIEKMKEIIPPQVNCLSLQAEYYRSYFREGTVHIYKRGRYPFDYIGPISFFWNATSTSLWLWVHPSFKFEALTELIDLFDLQEDPVTSKFEPSQKKQKTSTEDKSTVKSSLDARKLEAKNLFHPRMWRNTGGIELTDLEGALNRFRLSGPESTSVLQNLLRVQQPLPDSVSQQNVNILRSYETQFECKPSLWETQAKIWNGNRDYSDFPSDTVLPLTVRDPRIFMPKQRNKLIRDTKCEDEFEHEEFHAKLLTYRKDNESPLWNANARRSVLELKMSDSALGEERQKLLLPGLELALGERENQVPVILIHRPEQLGGWDLIVPAGWAMPFWLGLSFRCVRASGHRDALHFTFSRITSSNDEVSSIIHTSLASNLFPQDSISGNAETDLVQDQVKETYFRLPPDKRNQFPRLMCPFPFHIDWLKFLQFWQSLLAGDNSDCTTAQVNQIFVLREFKLLQVLRESLRTNCFSDNDAHDLQLDSYLSLNLWESCLIPIYVTSICRGKPEANSILCLPTAADLDQLYSNDLVYHNEPEPDRKQLYDLDEKKSELRRKHRKHLALLRKKRKKEIEYCKKFQTQYVKTESNYDSTDVCAEFNKQMNSLFIPDDPMTILKQMSRIPIGFITFGSESYKIGKGAGIGYISMGGFKRLISFYKEYHATNLLSQSTSEDEALAPLKNVVLIRDAKSSLTYRYAQLHIC